MEPATETIRIDDNVEAVAKEWDGLADDLRVPPFLRPGWMTAWLQTFGASPPRIYSAWREGQLIGLVPLLARRWRFVSPTNAHTPLFGVVANDARTTRALTRAVLDAEPQRVTFGYLDQHAPSSVVLGDVLRERGFHTLSQTRIRSPYSEVDGDWAVFEARLKKNRRSELRRRRRRLEERGKVTVDIEDGAGDLDRLLAEGYEVEASGWKGERGTAIQSTPATTNFYSNVARWAVSCGWLRLAFLRVGNRPIAFQYMLRYDDSVYYLKGGYDEAYRKWSPGILLSYEVLRHSFFDGEIRSFEWLGADDAYKTEWSDGERTRVRLDAFAPTPLGRARLASTLAWRATEARGRQLARSRMPPALRDRAQTVYGRIDNLRRR